MTLWRLSVRGTTRWATGTDPQEPTHLLPVGTSMDSLLTSSHEFEGVANLPRENLPSGYEVLAPIGGQEVWASGVTFLESRYARETESNNRNVYREVYHAKRPELFLKASPHTTVGPGQPIGIRRDSTWDVPEPELGLVICGDGRIAAYTLGNDVSSRSIEGDNPLYLPQAKIYDSSCSIGPCMVPVSEAPKLSEMTTELEIERQGISMWSGSISMSKLKRSPAELVSWLFRARTFPHGVILLTGTGLVPPDDFTLAPGDVVRISIVGIGTLTNEVVRVGHDNDYDDVRDSA